MIDKREESTHTNNNKWIHIIDINVQKNRNRAHLFRRNVGGDIVYVLK